jgi:hypothetical protein
MIKETKMMHKNARRNRLFLMLVAAFAALSMACGLINRVVDTVTDSGLQALEEFEVVEQLITAMEMAEGMQINWSELEAPGSEFLFEIDPFDDVIRWRFYAIQDEPAEVGEFYMGLVPDFLIENDQQISGHRYLVLTAGHPLSSIYTKEQFQAVETDYYSLPSTLLDVEVLHSSAHSGSGRLAIADVMGLLPRPVPANSTLVILVYNLSTSGWENFLPIAPGIIPDLGDETTPADPEELTNGDESDQAEPADDDLVFDDTDDENGEIQDPSALCNQVLASGACYHPYIPVVEGFSRSYQTGDGTMTETVSEVRAEGFTLTTEMPDGNSFSSEFECGAAGITGWAADESVLDLMSAEHDMYSEVEVEGAALPQEISPGDTWQVTVNLTIGVQAQGVDSRNEIVLNFDYTAVGEETITTPAGRFSAMRVDFTGTGENTLVVTGPAGSLIQSLATLESAGSDWYVPCVGKVRSNVRSTWSGIANVETETQMMITDFGLR